jgi:hypothetical protein
MDSRIKGTIRYKGQQVSLMDNLPDGEYTERSFEDHFKPDTRSDYSDLIQKEKLPTQEPKKEEKPKKGKNLVELLTGGEDIGEFARKLNLDPEMAEKMLVPLLSLLDKYGVDETLTASPRMESATNAFEIIRDVSPVIKGAAEFISGRRAELESTDLAFLEQIKEAQAVTDATLFADDEDELFAIGESIVEEPVVQAPQEPQPAPLDLNSFDSNDWGNFFANEGSMVQTEKKHDIVNNELSQALDAQNDAVLDWAKTQSVALKAKVSSGKNIDMNVRTDYHNMDIGGPSIPQTFAEVAGVNTESFAIVEVSELAKSQGIPMNTILQADSQRKINNEVQEEYVTEPIDISEFIPEETTTYEDLGVPDNLADYDPLHVADYELPNFDLYEISLEDAEQED